MFMVPHKHAEAFKSECKCLCEEDVLELEVEPGHAYPNLLIPNKDRTVGWMSDFRKLNLILRWRVYPLP